MNNLLQITEAPDSLTWFELLSKGGVIMIPIFLLSLAALYVFIERYLFLSKATKHKREFMTNIKSALQSGDIASAKSFAKMEPSSTGVIILSGLNSIGKPTRDIESTLESSTNIQIAEMENHTGYLGIIAGVAPMLGFIGTISGIIQIFYNISLSDNISIGIIAGGLYEKMITSGSGLVVGVLAYSAYHLLHLKIHRFTLQIQKDVFDFLHAITNPGKN
ncbi:MAG: MotA/TolQ/ExbB proton channel family protein [Cyclobacteriaceae bacterium]